MGGRASMSPTRSYYEHEARTAGRGPLRGRRVQWRSGFIELIRAEGRRSIVDFGAGPGRDLEGFVAEGLEAVGIDLAVGNGRLAASRGVVVVPGSVAAPPLRPGVFEAGWSMSTFMHLSDDDAAAAAGALVAAVEPGSPILIGVWGSESAGLQWDERTPGERRPFHLRSLDDNARLFAAGAELESAERIPDLDDFSDYQLFRMRTPGS